MSKKGDAVTETIYGTQSSEDLIELRKIIRTILLKRGYDSDYVDSL